MVNFDYSKDTLITLGDIVDGWSESYECIEELLKIKHRVDIRGNHDIGLLEFALTGNHPFAFTHGSMETIISYGKRSGAPFEIRSKYGKDENGEVIVTHSSNLSSSDIPMSHVKFLNNQVPYYVDKDKNLFVHGGFNRHLPISEQDEEVLYCDRDLWLGAMSAELGGMKYNNKDGFKHIFIGHSPTIKWGSTDKMTHSGITNLDTGAGFGGSVTIMNVETGESFQSTPVRKLYPNERGR